MMASIAQLNKSSDLTMLRSGHFTLRNTEQVRWSINNMLTFIHTLLHFFEQSHMHLPTHTHPHLPSGIIRHSHISSAHSFCHAHHTHTFSLPHLMHEVTLTHSLAQYWWNWALSTLLRISNLWRSASWCWVRWPCGRWCTGSAWWAWWRSWWCSATAAASQSSGQTWRIRTKRTRKQWYPTWQSSAGWNAAVLVFPVFLQYRLMWKHTDTNQKQMVKVSLKMVKYKSLSRIIWPAQCFTHQLCEQLHYVYCTTRSRIAAIDCSLFLGTGHALIARDTYHPKAMHCYVTHHTQI